MLRPSVSQMLRIGKGCELNTLGEAYNNYISHYDCFFLISDYENQYKIFAEDILSLGWIDEEGFILDSLLIDDCLKELDK